MSGPGTPGRSAARLRSWAGPVLGTAALALLAELALRAVGFTYARQPVTLRFVRAVADKGAESSGAGKAAVRIPYALDPVLLWRPRSVPGLTNSDGFLGPEWPADKPAGLRRVVALGDSCTILGEDPYPGVLAGLLGKDGRRWEVLNAGVASWSSCQGLALLKSRVPALAPDVVTVYFGWNDMWRAWTAPDKDLAALLERQWRFLRVVQSCRLLQAFQRLADSLAGPPSLRESSPRRVPLADFAGNLAGMVAQARAAGAEPVLVTLPTGLTLEEPATAEVCAKTKACRDAADFAALHEAYNAAVRRAARDAGAPLADLARAFAGMEKDRRKLFSDGIHLTAEGHRRAAALLEPEVRRAFDAARRRGKNPE